MADFEHQTERTEHLATAAMRHMAVGNLCAENEPQKLTDKTIGKYKITGYIGGGGMGNVYAAHHPDLDIPVALKTIREEYARNESYITRFFKEAQLATQLNHPNIVRVYDVDCFGDTYYMVQELVTGGDVQQRIKNSSEGYLSTKDALAITTAIAKALVEAERLNIVHRDIKPKNILLTEDGMPKLADLGLAKQLNKNPLQPEELEQTQAGSTFGSPAYMPPEQINDSREVDCRSDIYSLGVTFYQLLTGELPFSASSAADFYSKHAHDRIDDPRRINPSIPACIVAIIRKMTAKSPSRRYQTASELLEALENVNRNPLKRYLPVYATVLVLFCAAVLLNILFRNQPSVTPIDEAVLALTSGDYKKADAALQNVLQEKPDDPRALYALGLCRLEKNQTKEIDAICSRLNSTSQGGELAAHLGVLQKIRSGDLDAAAEVVNQWIDKAEHGLLFFAADGTLRLAKHDYTGAEASLSQAVQQASVFGFQKLAVFDTLGRLLAAQGRNDEASRVYAQALEKKPTSTIANPALYTNYAITLLNSEQTDKALEPLQVALQIDPANEMAHYLHQKVSAQNNQLRYQLLQQTLAMIEEVDAAIPAQGKTADLWSLSPVVLVFLPPDAANPDASLIGEEKLYVDKLIEQIRLRQLYPVVTRTALAEILREYKLSTSELSSPQARMKLRQLLPASVLIKCNMSMDTARRGLRVRLVDTITSEIIGIIDLPRQPKQDDNDYFSTAAQSLLMRLQDHFPLRGRIISVNETSCEIDIGRYHGVAQGMNLNVYIDETDPNWHRLQKRPPAAELRVTEAGRFKATAQVVKATDDVHAGMLVTKTTAP